MKPQYTLKQKASSTICGVKPINMTSMHALSPFCASKHDRWKWCDITETSYNRNFMGHHGNKFYFSFQGSKGRTFILKRVFMIDITLKMHFYRITVKMIKINNCNIAASFLPSAEFMYSNYFHGIQTYLF